MRYSPYLFLIQTPYLLKELRNLSGTRVLLDYPVKPGPRHSQLLALSDRNGLDMIFHRSYRLAGNYSLSSRLNSESGRVTQKRS